MSIENIIDYVNETPHNTNIGILRNKLELHDKEITKGTVKSVNRILPDEQGNVDVATVASWNDLTDRPFGAKDFNLTVGQDAYDESNLNNVTDVYLTEDKTFTLYQISEIPLEEGIYEFGIDPIWGESKTCEVKYEGIRPYTKILVHESEYGPVYVYSFKENFSLFDSSIEEPIQFAPGLYANSIYIEDLQNSTILIHIKGEQITRLPAKFLDGECPYEESVIKTFEYDGIIEGDAYMDMGEGFKIYYINDTILTHDYLVGSIQRIPDWTGAEMTQDYLNYIGSVSPILYDKFDNGFVFQYTVFIAKANTTWDTLGVPVVFDKPGVYALASDETGTAPYSITWTESTIHKLDPKFLPDYMEGVSF